MEIDKTQIGKRIRELRTIGGFSIRQLADKIGIDNSSLGKIEKGELGIPLEKLVEISSIFGVSLDQVVLGGGNFEQSNPFSMNEEDILLALYKEAMEARAHRKATQAFILKAYSATAKKDFKVAEKEFNDLYEQFLKSALNDPI